MQNNTDQMRKATNWFSSRPSNSLPTNPAIAPAMEAGWTNNVKRLQSGLAGYQPVENSKDEDNRKVKVIIGKDNKPPYQDPSVFYRVNEKHTRNQFTETVNVPLDFKAGFLTISDYLAYSFCEKAFDTRNIVQFNRDLSGEPEAFVHIQIELYVKNKNKPIVDLTDMINYLTSSDFIRTHTDKNLIVYMKFNELNLPVEYVNLNIRTIVRGELIQGHVKSATYEKIKELFKDNLQPIVDRVSIQQLDGYDIQPGRPAFGQFSNNELTPDMDVALGEFYPWIKMDIVDYFNEFFNSRSNVLILIGPPGTGKSTLIRTIIRDLRVRTLLAYKHDVITSPHFITICQNFMSSLDSDNTGEDGLRRHKAVVVEDADLIMEKRSNGNMRMSEILNATSGIVSDSHNKFILSTNLKDISEIDPALMRPGRCFDVLCFRDLSSDEATIIRNARGLAPREFNKGTRYKLAEVLNESVTQLQVEPVVKPRFGFVD